MARLSTLIVGVSLAAATLTLPTIANAADVYTIQEGDTLSGIAANVGVPLDDLLRANGLTVNSVILPGQHLDVPDVGAGGPATAASGSIHTVAAGDTLSGIARRAGVSLSSLLQLNRLGTSSLIMPGMQLTLPAGAAASARATPNTPAQRVVDFALAQVGKPYVFFTKGPGTFDCSGLSMAAYAQAGVPLVHQAAAQAQQGTGVDYWNEAIQTGDLIFLDGDWDGVIDHVGIALNATTWVQASQSHDTVLTGPIPSDSVIVAVRRFL